MRAACFPADAPTLGVTMSYKIQQHRIKRSGMSYHFVSYAGQPANPRKGEAATGPMWYMMRAGKRWPVMPEVPGQSEAETMRALAVWLEDRHLPDEHAVTPA